MVKSLEGYLCPSDMSDSMGSGDKKKTHHYLHYLDVAKCASVASSWINKKEQVVGTMFTLVKAARMVLPHYLGLDYSNTVEVLKG